jgi:NAD(P)-dependent dehydrogenase (short-subunit alcohol dehydrogenase family)
MEVNLFGAWRMTNALLPLLCRSEHPRIVHISSGAGSHDDDQFGLRKRHGAAAVYGTARQLSMRSRVPDDGPRGGFFRDGQPLGW